MLANVSCRLDTYVVVVQCWTTSAAGMTSPCRDTCVVVPQCWTTSAAVSRPGSAGQDEDRDPGRGDGGGGRGH